MTLEISTVFNKIIVPLDGSQLSAAVVSIVEHMTACTPTEVVLVHVVPPPAGRSAALFRPFSPDIPISVPRSPADAETRRHPVYRDQEIASAEAEARNWLAPVLDQLAQSGVNARIEILFGRPAEAILQYASLTGADLIVMATHGRTGALRLLMGSVCEDVMRGAQIPVMVIRPRQVTDAATTD